jgi:hypothetical protein
VIAPGGNLGGEPGRLFEEPGPVAAAASPAVAATIAKARHHRRTRSIRRERKPVSAMTVTQATPAPRDTPARSVKVTAPSAVLS